MSACEPTPAVTAPVAATEAEKTRSRELRTRTGLPLFVRCAAPDDLPRLEAFFRQVTPEDMRHRFLSAIRQPGPDRLQEMVRNDDPRVVDLLATDPATGDVVATAMLVSDQRFDNAEFAICTRADRKHQGVSWTLLEHLIRFARAAGISNLQSIQTADDNVAMQLEREMGFSVSRCPDDPTLMVAEKQLG